MDFNKIYSSLSEKFPELDIRRDEDMRLHTSFRIGGPARIFVEAESEKQLAALICALNELGAKYLVIGRGTNLLVKDEGFEGVVIHMGEGIAHIDAGNRSINAEAGASLAAIASAALQHGLTGMEVAHGIPGSLGGALLMNAGAYGGEMADIVDFVRYLDAEGNIREADAADCRFGYRHSRFEDEPCVILGARL
ncbi:MAG: FAD-binding protein, partial [Clostridia bacterium]|nr:FAD-binding protein [Clostridia bacterium]